MMVCTTKPTICFLSQTASHWGYTMMTWIVNPLGSHTSVHKLGFFYYIVKELPSEYNSQLANCHLLQVYYSADRKKYGFSKILANIVEELKLLERCSRYNSE